VKDRDNTFYTPLVPCLNELGFPPIPNENDKAEQLREELWTIGSCWESPSRWWGDAYNPEKYLNHWAAILSGRPDLSFDVIGWAFFAAKREAEYKKQKELLPYDFLTGQTPRSLLLRLTRWAEARLCYHRVGLHLTFYKRDALAAREPIASNVEWLRQRLKQFVAVRMKEIKPEPYLDIKFYNLPSKLDYLCWLHLVSHISERWTLHEISKAVKKTFFDESYFRFRQRWWVNKTKEDQSLKDQTLEVHLVNKSTVAAEFDAATADWLSDTLSNLRPFSDSLADLLMDTGFRYRKRRGRAPTSRTETPSDVHDIRAILLGNDPLENFEILGKKDLRKDEPKGWLLAKTITA